ncbi:arginase [Niveispirillum fermenti]|uniref:arginase n=1 Tax=Niveispirillum fermenti TaxID=1233113 RepID=UPI003A8928C7
MSGWYGLVGAPTDVGNVDCGAAEGPGALRAMGLPRRMGMVDRGDVRGPAYDGRPDATGSRSVRETAAWCAAVRDGVAGVLADGGFPLMLGGDHAMALGSIAAAAAHARQEGRNFFVLWFDAHPDFNTPETTPSGNTHGYPAALACGIGHPDLLSVGAFTPLIRPDRLIQFGVRDIDAGERANLLRIGVEFHEMDAVREKGLEALVAHTIARIQAAGGGHVHVSFDIDALDPAAAPGVGTPVSGGLTPAETVGAMRLLGASGLVRSLDIVEFAPRHDRDGMTALTVEQVLAGFMAGRTGQRALVA